MIFRANQGDGKSGSFFFFSADRKFIIKTLRGSEKNKLLSIMKDLITHYTVNKDSLLSRIYGLFTLKSKFFDPIDVIIMGNTSYLNKKNEKMVFDLKGSTKGRYTNILD